MTTPSPSEIPTPRTDAATRELCIRSKEASDLGRNPDWNYVVPSKVSKQLERELSQSQAEVERLKATNMDLDESCQAWAVSLQKERKAWKKERDSLLQSNAALSAQVEVKDKALVKCGKIMSAMLEHCKIDECEDCSKILCPFEEPLHFHHDGCPACCNAPKSEQDKVEWFERAIQPLPTKD